MIVSHQYKFIYLKTIKTASTSMENALNAICGPDDIITPTAPRFMKLRTGQRAQHYRLDHPAVPSARCSNDCSAGRNATTTPASATTNTCRPGA